MKIIWTNGCFDIIHAGHVEMLKFAKSLGDLLIVGIDSDGRVGTLKGSGRPINSQDLRQRVLESIRYVDEVVVFNSKEEMEDILRQRGINLIVVGEDYREKEVTGSSICQVEFFPKISGLSTTSILDRINSL